MLATSVLPVLAYKPVAISLLVSLVIAVLFANGAGAYHALVVSQPTPSNSDVDIQAIGVLGLKIDEELVLLSLFFQCHSLMQLPHIAPVT